MGHPARKADDGTEPDIETQTDILTDRINIVDPISQNVSSTS